MAYLRQHPKSTYWIANWRNKDGKLMSRSTKIKAEGKKSHEEAMKIAQVYEASDKGNKTIEFIRKTISDVSTSILAKDISTPSVREWLNTYLDLRQHDLAVSTMASNRRAFDIFCRFLDERSNDPVGCVTKADALNFHAAQKGRVCLSTAGRYAISLSVAFDAAVEREYLLLNPFNAVKKKRARNKDEGIARKAFTFEQIRILLEKLPEEWKSMVITSLYTGGQRLGDIACLRWDAIDFKIGVLRFSTKKTGRGMIVPLFPALRYHLEQVKAVQGKGSEYVHPIIAVRYNEGRQGELSVEFTSFVKAYGMVSGYSPIPLQGDRRRISPLSFHSLRSTAATFLHTAGVPEAIVREIVGHSSETVHQLYIKLGSDAITSALEKLPDFSTFESP